MRAGVKGNEAANPLLRGTHHPERSLGQKFMSNQRS